MHQQQPNNGGELEVAFAERLRPFANLVVALTGVMALGTVGLAAILFERDLTLVQLTVFYVLPALWVLGSAAVLRSGAEVRLGFALIQISLGVSLLGGEVAATLWIGSRNQGSTESSVREQVRQLRAKGADAFQVVVGNIIVNLSPTIIVANDALHPIAPGPGHATIRLCDEDSPIRTYTSDRFGFDNPDSVWSASTESVTIVGDSYTVGVCVPSDEAIPGRLRTGRPVLNLGISGTGPLQQLALLREYGSQLRSKQVVWVYYEGNDLWDLAREEERDWLVRYLSPTYSQSLRAYQPGIDAGFRNWIDSVSRSAPQSSPATPSLSARGILSLTSIRTLLTVSFVRPGEGKNLGRLPEILARARADVESWGGELIVVYMPAYVRYHTVAGDPVPSRAAVLRLLQTLGIRIVDLHEPFVATGDPRKLWVTPRSHLTARGYRLAADEIERALANSVADPN